jgi:DNA-binding transcriptional ArsR family regulator
MKFAEIKPEQLEKAANMLKAISHPMRISIINHLSSGQKLTVSELQEKLNIEQSVASHHLGILKDKGVLSSERDGKNTYYFLKHEKISNIIDCMQNCV